MPARGGARCGGMRSTFRPKPKTTTVGGIARMDSFMPAMEGRRTEVGTGLRAEELITISTRSSSFGASLYDQPTPKRRGARMGQKVPGSIYREELMRPPKRGLLKWLPSMKTWIPRLLRTGLPLILLGGLIMNMAVICLFAGLLYAAGEDCIAFHDDANGTRNAQFYERVIWVSMHSFTTIGYGSGFPTCHTTEFLIFLEYYTSNVGAAAPNAASREKRTAA